jgi:hypothetical protein
MFSVVALPAHLADRFSPALARALRLGSMAGPARAEGFAFDVPQLDAVLPDAGLLRGGVVELALREGVPATSLVLSACRAIQRASEREGRSLPWCAFIDPSSTLHAPGVVEAGVRLERLLVVRPPLDALSRTALRLAKSAAFELVVVDLVGVRGASPRVSPDSWQRTVRRLAMEVDGTRRSVVLLTDALAPCALPLPVAQRIELERPRRDRLIVRVAKDCQGRVGPPRPITWTRVKPGPEQEGEEQHAKTG